MDTPKPTDPLHDPARLGALRQTRLLDSAPEGSFDRLTRLAARLLKVPVALVSLVDEGRQFFKSQVGLSEPWASARQTPLSYSFCRHVVVSGRPLVVVDARRDPLVRDSLAVSDLGVVAYAGVPLVTGDGHVLGSFCAIDTKPRDWSADDVDLLHDLAAAAMTEVGLRRARDTAEAANRAKDRHLAFLAHELRGPLTPALMAASAMAADAALPENVRADAEVIRRNIELTTRLADDLLDANRIALGKLDLRLAPVDVHETLREAAAMCAADAAAKGVRLDLDLRASRHTARADAAKLTQVWTNLMKNAVKFTPAGGSVTARTSDAGGGRLRVEVADTGVGVDAKLLPRMFDLYEQGDRHAGGHPGPGGLGLGLAICKGIVDAHGGTIAASTSGPGRGTTLTVELPATAAPVHAAPAPRPTAPPPAAGNTSAKGLRILLVDDHNDTLRVMSRLLKALGYHVTTATGVGSALAAAGDFDLLISDVDLGDGSGLDLVRELRNRRPADPIRGIALTGYGTEEDIRQTREAGFEAHVTKPVDFDALEKTLRRLAR